MPVKVPLASRSDAPCTARPVHSWCSVHILCQPQHRNTHKPAQGLLSARIARVHSAFAQSLTDTPLCTGAECTVQEGLLRLGGLFQKLHGMEPPNTSPSPTFAPATCPFIPRPPVRHPPRLPLPPRASPAHLCPHCPAAFFPLLPVSQPFPQPHPPRSPYVLYGPPSSLLPPLRPFASPPHLAAPRPHSHTQTLHPVHHDLRPPSPLPSPLPLAFIPRPHTLPVHSFAAMRLPFPSSRTQPPTPAHIPASPTPLPPSPIPQHLLSLHPPCIL